MTSNPIVGEGSASTFWDNRRITSLQIDSKITYEAETVIANEIHHITPGAKIIVILRNPTTRFTLILFIIDFSVFPHICKKKKKKKKNVNRITFFFYHTGYTQIFCISTRKVIIHKTSTNLLILIYKYSTSA